MSQLTVVVDRGILFSNYTYRSGVSSTYRDHCRRLARDLMFALNHESFHIDIAGNDGTLCKEFMMVTGCRSMNVDPAKNYTPDNEAQGVRMFNTFWGMKAAAHLQNTGWPKADVITATNVIAHVDDLDNFFMAIKLALKPDGLFIIEFPYLADMLVNTEFSQVYFEHLSYFSILPLKRMAEKYGMSILGVEHIDIHCGSVRVTIGHGKSNISPYGVFEPLITDTDYDAFAVKTRDVVTGFREGLDSLPGKVCAFAASAKGNTLLNCANVTDADIKAIYDHTPEKQGKYSPGTGIPIVSPLSLSYDDVDYLVILAWNFAEEIMRKCRDAGYNGRFVIPVPKFVII